MSEHEWMAAYAVTGTLAYCALMWRLKRNEGFCLIDLLALLVAPVLGWVFVLAVLFALLCMSDFMQQVRLFDPKKGGK